MLLILGELHRLLEFTLFSLLVFSYVNFETIRRCGMQTVALLYVSLQNRVPNAERQLNAMVQFISNSFVLEKGVNFGFYRRLYAYDLYSPTVRVSLVLGLPNRVDERVHGKSLVRIIWTSLNL